MEIFIEDNTPFYGQEVYFYKKYDIIFEYKNERYTLKINEIQILIIK